MLKYRNYDDYTSCFPWTGYDAHAVDICKVDGENSNIFPSCMAHLTRAMVDIVEFVSRILSMQM